MELKIVRLDNHGRGISYINSKIIFIENALPDEIVEVEITKETSKFLEGKVKKYIEQSNERVKSKCPFYEECGGCQLRHLSYDNNLTFKQKKVTDIIKKYAGLDIKPQIIKNKNHDLYRNKVEFKIENGEIGFYKKSSHELVCIDRCLNTEEPINFLLLNYELLHIKNGTLTIKTNYNGELILIINSEDEQNIEVDILREKYKLVGIIYNGNLVFGADHFIEIIDEHFFKESYNSFFQVNRNINLELFKIIKDNVNDNETVLDLCSGVGTLSIIASEKAKKVYAIEIVENAVRDSLINAKMNKRDNINFILGDAFKSIDKIEEKLDTFIVDPPRSGLTKDAVLSILEKEPSKIIYISCDPVTLARDLNVLKTKYEIKKSYILDMFSYTYHVETIAILKKM